MLDAAVDVALLSRELAVDDEELKLLFVSTSDAELGIEYRYKFI